MPFLAFCSWLRARVGVMELRASNVSMFSRMGRLLIWSPFLSLEISISAVPRAYSSFALVVFISI